MPYPGMEHSAACLSVGRHLNPPMPPAHIPPPHPAPPGSGAARGRKAEH